MAQFNGFVCDSCDEVFPMSHRTKKIVKYDGTDVQGEVSFDLCSECAVRETEDLEMKPLRRRGRPSGQAVVTPDPTSSPVADTPGVGQQ